MTNPLLEDHELPPFDRIEAAHVEPAIDAILEENRATIAALVESGERNWAGFVKPLEEINDRLHKAWSPVSHLKGVMDSDELRKAYNNALAKISEYETERGQNKGLFDAYQAIAASAEYTGMTAAQKKVIDNEIRDFRLSGVDLPEAEKKRYGEISKRLTELSSRFSDNLLDATMAWTKLITDKSELAGLPESTFDMLKQTAEQRGEQGYMLTLDFPCYLPVMTYCDNRALRAEIQQAFTTRASEKGPYAGKWNNGPVMEEILALRQEMAALLGFENYAELSLATKMARSPQEVMAFLDELSVKSKPAADREFAELTRFARETHGIENLEPWDIAYYSEKFKQQQFDVSEEQLRPWFPVPKVFEGMFEVVRRLYGVDIAEAEGITTWHPDVTTWNLYRDGELLARFYLDLYARSGKRGGAWMDDCRIRRSTLAGELQLPVAYLTCNFSPPVGGTPSLLTHDEVLTLFHEFGHGLHHMLTQVDCAEVSGINGVAWDAVELPSQFMENWCWQEEALNFISGHYKTGEPLPTEQLNKLLKARNFQSAMATVRQLEFSLFDFRLHMEFDPGIDNQIQQILDEVRDAVAVVPVAPENRFQHGFGHIFGGGYAAGYYSYKWAEVLSADAFGRFREEGIFNRQTGEQFLRGILERGGSVDAMDMFVEFRGREPDIEALLQQDGIVAA